MRIGVSVVFFCSRPFEIDRIACRGDVVKLGYMLTVHLTRLFRNKETITLNKKSKYSLRNIISTKFRNWNINNFNKITMIGAPGS